MLSLWIESVFWGASLLLFHTSAGYPLVLEALARVCPRPVHPIEPNPPPPVTVLLVARATEPRLDERIQNLAGLDYPADRLGCVLVRDGGNAADAPPVPPSPLPLRVIDLPAGSGKPAGLNAGIAAIAGGIVVFADARQDFARDAVRRLVRNFGDPEIGAVSGALEIRKATTATGSGVDTYWRIEKRIRWNESRTGSCVGCTGAIYAARRELLTPIPEDTWLDDVLIPMRIAQLGARVLFEPDARAFDPQPLEPETENRRKPRTLGGNIQLLVRHPAWILPGVGRLWWRYLSHKALRLTGPALLAILFLTGAALAPLNPFYAALFAGQLTLYLLGFTGILSHARNPLLRFPAGFLFLNAMVIRGFAFWWQNRGRRTWATPTA